MNPAILRQLIAQMTPEQLAALGLRRPATDAEAASYDQAHAPGGAPADFAGPVFSNPDNARVSEDTESGGEPTRLPIGVNFQKQNFSGAMPLDRSNPLPAELGGIHASTVQAKFDPAQPYEKTTAGEAKFDPAASYEAAPAEPAKKAEPGFLDRELPVDQGGPELVQIAPGVMIPLYKNATLSGVQSLGRSARDAATGLRDLFKAPQDKTEAALSTAVPGSLPIYRMLAGMGHTAKDSLQAVAAIRDINASPDPVSEYGKMLQGMASDGAVQALTAAATEGFIKGVPKAAAALTSDSAKAAVTAPVRLGARAAETAINQKLLPVKKLAKLMTPADEAETLTVKVPGRDFGLGKPPAEALKAPVYPGASLPADPGTFPGAPLPETPSPEALQARVLEQGGRAPIDPAKGLGEIPTPGEKPPVSTGNAPEAVPGEIPADDVASAPRGAGVPRTLSGESALTQILTGQDNANLIKIARSRGINVTQEAQLKPGVADTRLIKKIIDDHTPEELGEIRDTYLEHTRFRHNFGDIGPEAWKALSIQTYFPDVKLPAAVLKRTQSAIEAAGKPPAEVMNAPASEAATPKAPKIEATPKAKTPDISKDDLLEKLTQSVEQAKSKRNAGVLRFVYRARDVGEEGVPLQANSHGQATSEPLQATKYAEPGQRGTELGQVVRIDLSKLNPSDYVVSTHPDGMKWVRFTRPLTEDEVTHFAGAGAPDAAPQPAPVAESAAPPARARVSRKRVDNALAARSIPKAEASDVPTPETGNASAGETIPRSSAASEAAPSGAETKVRVPGEDHSYDARYQVRELADVQPSHSGINFNANEKYALVNDRDYANSLNQGKVVTNSAPGKFDPSYHITDNPDATNGPVVIDSEGHALGGNGRAMILQRVYKYNPEGAAAYKDLLAKKAQQFGLDPEKIAGMKEPVLVRELADHELEPATRQKAITDFNKKGTAELTPAERAIADSKRISQDTLDHVAARIESEGQNGTLGDVLRGQSGTQVLDRLISDGVISPQERAAYANANTLTQAGTERIQKLMVARFFRDPAQVDSTPTAVRNKLESMTAPLARVDGVAGWDLTPHLQDALDLLEEARTHGTKNIDDLLGQSGLFGESAKYSPEAITLAKHLKDTPARALTGAVRQYAQDMADAHRPMFAEQAVKPEQAFREAFAEIKAGKRSANVLRDRADADSAGLF